MATVAQVAKASLQRILVQASESTLEQTEFSDFIFDMNNYMLALDAQGIKLGYTVVTGLSDEVTIPLGALRGLIANMAIEVAPDYDGEVSGALVKAAADGMNAMLQLGVIVGKSEFSGNLPRGTGAANGSSAHHRYYEDQEAEILAETTGAIGLETGTTV